MTEIRKMRRRSISKLMRRTKRRKLLVIKTLPKWFLIKEMAIRPSPTLVNWVLNNKAAYRAAAPFLSRLTIFVFSSTRFLQ